MPDDFTAHIPEDSIILNVLRVVEYMVPDGRIFKQDLSYSSDGEDLDTGKASELVMFASVVASFPLLADMLHDYVYGEEGEDD